MIHDRDRHQPGAKNHHDSPPMAFPLRCRTLKLGRSGRGGEDPKMMTEMGFDERIPENGKSTGLAICNHRRTEIKTRWKTKLC